MVKPPEKSDIVKAYLRRLGNPYASLQVSTDAEEMDADEVSSDAQRPYIRHPYALASLVEDENGVSSGLIFKQPAQLIGTTLSKAEFRARCRRIFEQYIPPPEKGRLRAYYRDFILRNESRSPKARYLLVHQLQKYDLSNIQGLKCYFNRERESLTEEKLKQIERLVDDEG